MNNSVVVMHKREASDMAWKRANSEEFVQKPVTVYRVEHDGMLMDSWVSGKVAISIVCPPEDEVRP